MSMICVPLRSGLFRGAVLLFASAFSLTGCASLPVSGPTGSEIRHAARAEQAQFPFALVEVESSAQVPPPPGLPAQTLAAALPRPTDLLGPGDVLNITIYEAGVALFGNSNLRSAVAASGGAVDTSSPAERLPAVRNNGALKPLFG